MTNEEAAKQALAVKATVVGGAYAAKLSAIVSLLAAKDAEIKSLRGRIARLEEEHEF